MKTTELTHRLVQLIVPYQQATPLIDLLLAQENTPFFTVMEAAGYGQPEEQLSPAEQVEGAQHKVKLEIEMAANEVQPLLRTIKQAMPTATVFYRLLPIIEHKPL